jgi:hypothetical protein
VSTPAHPLILAEAAEDNCPSDEYYAESHPLVGISSSKAGYSLYEVRVTSTLTLTLTLTLILTNLNLHTFPTLHPHRAAEQYKRELQIVYIDEQLTIEALISALQVQRAARLLLHRSVREIAVAGDKTDRVVKAIQAYARDLIPIEVYGDVGDSNALEGFLAKVVWADCLNSSSCGVSKQQDYRHYYCQITTTTARTRTPPPHTRAHRSWPRCRCRRRTKMRSAW